MDSSSEDAPSLPTSCSLCLRTLTSGDSTSHYQAVNMCSDCNFLVVEDLDSPIRDAYRWRSLGLRRRTRYNSSAESIENILSQQYSNVAREDQDNMFSTPSGSRRLRRQLSDTESDGIESISYGGSFNASDTDSETSAYGGTDTDIDPMNAGIYHWSSDDDDNGSRRRSLSLTGSTWSRLNLLSGDSEIDEILENLSGPPPAAVAVVNTLPLVVVRDADVACAICKESLVAESVVNKLPCSHLYHPSCILPWLSSRNTCPLCRYELPTENQESGKLRVGPGGREEGGGGGGGGPRSGGGRWYFIVAAAAPVLSVVSIALVLWLGNPLTETRRRSSVFKAHTVNHRGRRRWNLI